jgi:aryl-alcohol dehydrogenase-like predicted oxidoreductase
MTFGEPDEHSFMHGIASSEGTAHAVLDRAVEAGLNFVDTADVYGNDGITERVLGRWFASRGARDRMVLATKFRFRMAKGPNGTGASRRRILRTVEDSLTRLQTDRIDLYQIHMQDITTPEDETLRALDDLVRAGKVLYIGCSNYTAYRLVDSLWTSRVQHLERWVSAQMSYSLLQRDIEREHVPACLQWGVGILPYSPLAAGFLTGKVRPGDRPAAGTRLGKFPDRFARYDHDRGWRTLSAVEAAAQALGVAPSTVALAWLLHKPGVTSVIFGARTLEQLEPNLAASDLALPPETLAALDEASAVDAGYPYTTIQGIQGRW